MKNTKRIEKTIIAIKKLYGCNEKTKINRIYKDTRDGEYVCFISNRKMNPFAKKVMTRTEYVTMTNRYVWGMRVGYFCTNSEEYKRLESTGHYERVY